MENLAEMAVPMGYSDAAIHGQAERNYTEKASRRKKGVIAHLILELMGEGHQEAGVRERQHD